MGGGGGRVGLGSEFFLVASMGEPRGNEQYS